MEADLNFMMSHIWGRKINRYSENKGMVRNEQYGSRRNIRAQSLVLNKILSYDNSRIMRQESAHAENDSVNCYDRIIPEQAGITVQKDKECQKCSITNGINTPPLLPFYKSINGSINRVLHT